MRRRAWGILKVGQARAGYLCISMLLFKEGFWELGASCQSAEYCSVSAWVPEGLQEAQGLSVSKFPTQGCVNKVPGALLTVDGWHPSCTQGPVSGVCQRVSHSCLHMITKLHSPAFQTPVKPDALGCECTVFNHLSSKQGRSEAQ